MVQKQCKQDPYFESNKEYLLSDHYCPKHSARLLKITDHFAKYFSLQVFGTEKVPDGPFMLVTNHNIAFIFDLLLLHNIWHTHFPNRPSRGLAHRITWTLPHRITDPIKKMGAIYAHPEVAAKFLKEGCAVAVFPGGDIETTRPASEKHRINLAGRQGFARVAIENKVPIVPMVTAGLHSAYISLPGGQEVAKILGSATNHRLKAVPFTLGGLLYLCSLPLPLPSFALLLQSLFPFPAPVSCEFAGPISSIGKTPDQLYQETESLMQSTLDDLKNRRQFNWKIKRFLPQGLRNRLNHS